MNPEPSAIVFDVARAYERLRPVLFGVLRRLSRQGYVTRAGQGLDLIHDFFLEAWPGITERFDPAQGSFEAYVAGAFARFARPRLVREARWSAALEADPEARAELTVEDDSHQALDVTRVKQALAALGDSDRAILLARFGQVPTSERVLAAQRSTTRHRIREQVALALARLAVVVGERGVMAEPDFRVARLMFIEECSVAATAARLSLTEPQVRAARRRLLTALGRASLEVSP